MGGVPFVVAMSAPIVRMRAGDALHSGVF